MAKDYIGYEALADRALRGVVREALQRVEKQGLIGSHHFYLSFKTHGPGVEIPDFLKERYPDEMTIVLQNQYWGLKVGDKEFEVSLTFQKMPATLVIPYEALTAFADPSVQFGLQFRNASASAQNGAAASKEKPAAAPPAPVSLAPPPAAAPKDPEAASPPASDPRKDENAGPQVVSLDKFRKK
jgi:hypothetical protein